MSQSALYVGTIRHRRFVESSHRFSYPIFMLYVDLDERETVFSGSRLWSASRPSLAWLRRADYFGGDSAASWPDTVRDLVEERTGRRPEGAIRLLTNPRTLGLRMNPVSFYYCFDLQDRLQAVAAEITNTPWDERHVYVVDRQRAQVRERDPVAKPGSPPRSRVHWRTSFDKNFHVSPFLPIDMRYQWLLTRPDDRLVFHMENHREGVKHLDATLSLERRTITPKSLRSVLLGHPLQTLRILFWIYLHAAVLKIRGVSFHAHPKTRQEPHELTSR